MRKLLILLAMFQAENTTTYVIPDHVTSNIWPLIEQHCVAVLTEAHTEKFPMINSDDRVADKDDKGNWIIHVPEQTLKLRCK